MTRSEQRALVAVGLLVLLWSSDGSAQRGELFRSGASSSRKALPKRLGKPSSTPTPSSSLPGGGNGAGVVDVSSPTVREYSVDELDELEARAARPRPTVGTVKASPELEPRHGSSPAGFDPAQARAQAQGVASMLAKKGPRAYSHAQLAAWQTLAGLKSDGLYAGSTRGALVYYGVSNPPRPFGQPVATLPYHPPDVNP